MSRFVVQNFGCRASQADGASIEAQLINQGHQLAADSASADLVVLNTCTVTSNADDDMRRMVRRAHRLNPAAQIVVTGCYAQRAPAEIASLPGVSLVVGNSHKTSLAQLLEAAPQHPYHGEIFVSDAFEQSEFSPSPIHGPPGTRSRPNLKIQDGCSNRCSFCIIPSVRGNSRSAATAQVLNQVRQLSQTYPEIILTGINLGRWGREQGFSQAGSRLRLPDLLRLLLKETDVQRLRLSSVEPMDWSDDLLGLLAGSPRLAKHVHAPLQSGSDAVLRRMHRKYRPRHYESRIHLARQWMPDAAIGADVMTGFPGETEAEFNETVDFIESLPFTYLHVFPYSERPGTPAAASSVQIPWLIRKQRGQILQSIADRKNKSFRQSMLGRTLSAVTLYSGEAITSNYLTVDLSVRRKPLRIIDVTPVALAPNGLCEQQPIPIYAPNLENTRL